MNKTNKIIDLGELLINGGWRVRVTSPRGFRGLLLGMICLIAIILFDALLLGAFGSLGRPEKVNYSYYALRDFNFYGANLCMIVIELLLIMGIHPSIRFQLHSKGISVDKWCFSKPPRKIRRKFDDLKQLKVVCSYPPPYWRLTFIWFDGMRVSVNSFDLILPPVKEWIDKLNIPREKIDWFSYDSKDKIKGFTKTSEDKEKPSIKDYL